MVAHVTTLTRRHSFFDDESLHGVVVHRVILVGWHELDVSGQPQGSHINAAKAAKYRHLSGLPGSESCQESTHSLGVDTHDNPQRHGEMLNSYEGLLTERLFCMVRKKQRAWNQSLNETRHIDPEPQSSGRRTVAEGLCTVGYVQPKALAPTRARSILDCASLEPGDRFDAWTDAVSRSFVPLRADLKDPVHGRGFDGRIVSQSLGRSEISTVAGSGMAVHRSPRAIARNDPGFIKLGLQVRGYSVISQDDRDAALAPGDFAIYDTSRPYVLDFAESFEMFVVMFPAELIRFDRSLLSTLTASRFSGRSGLGAITSSLLREMSRQLDAEPLVGDFSLGDAVLDLVTASLAERLGPDGVTDEDSRRRSLLVRIETYIAANLSDSDLSVAEIAAAHHVSVRYLQKLFEEQHETVSGWIRHRRLEQCRKDLSNPAFADRTVGAIGSAWGFPGAASFSRAFRQEFGLTPSDFRTRRNSADDLWS
ncbi:helix-turn-helix domain-containing protein [Cryobacterium sp. TMT4-10]|nr:helix-turn-helix domain-containing protein [Cryobacterium sp. TMT4-10]